MRILALVPGGIGDQILFFPTVADLKKYYPQAQIDVVVEPRAVGAYRVCAEVDQVFPFDFKDRNSLADWGNLLGSIREREYEAVLSLGQRSLVGLFLWLTGIPKRVGYAGGGKIFLTDAIPLNANQYAGALYHDLLKGFGINTSCPNPKLTLARQDLDWAIAEQQRLGLAGQGYLVLHGGSSTLAKLKGLQKVYPVEKWAIVLRAIREQRPNLPFVVVQGPDDAEFVAELRKSNLDFLVVQPPDIGKLAAIIAGADLMLCTDSAPMHLAVASGTRTIALFGPFEPAKLLPADNRFIGIKAQGADVATIPPQEIIDRLFGR
ncbi:glycosyltransferase family 9 protein [Synechococcus elongatus]|uniref:Glycosyltransferase family 9 protein n=1 Tax=Synechococcus elongatus PCC 11802 TaxID=2283154 RepID=A0AAT9JX59_SYNEL|nr:glycosyltransferase family 9 protein [Synechococcus elongatus]QFZ93151.1 lipopolysaccharide heptosyltransferase family protein [Synechococcus elongatus PCC 11802]